MSRFPVVPEPRAVFTDFGQMFRHTEDTERDSETYVLDEPLSELEIHRSNAERTLTQPVFQKICGRLSPGLGRLVLDIAGITPSDDSRMVSSEIAIEIFNAVLKLRQNRLTDSAITVNSSTGRVEGFVGSGFRRLSNTDFLTMVEGFVVSPFKFIRGIVNGRSIALLFGSSVEQHRVSGFSPGFYFANSDSGFSGVKAYKSLVRSNDGSFAIRRSSSTRKLSHVGHDIRSRFRAILRREVSDATEEDIQEIKSLVKKSQLAACRLRPEYPSYFQQTIETIAHRICSFGKGTNYQLVMQAILSKLKQSSAETMTAFDLFDALSTEASKRTIQVAEMSAVSAYLALANADLCFGKGASDVTED